MPHVLEVRGGEHLTPPSVLDIMEAVEDYIGTDTHQYLKEYLLEAENEVGEIAGEETYDHYRQVFINIKDETEAAVRLMGKPHVDWEAVRVTLDIILRMIERKY